MKYRVIAFDLFGTLLDMRTVPQAEQAAYVSHVRNPDGWSPLTLPRSWGEIRAFPEVREGLTILREAGYLLCTLSNAPLETIARISRTNGFVWDAIVPLELIRSFKPHPSTYDLVPALFRAAPSDCLMVTANRTAGDLEGAAGAGMSYQLIRTPSIPDLTAFVKKLSALDGSAGG